MGLPAGPRGDRDLLGTNCRRNWANEVNEVNEAPKNGVFSRGDDERNYATLWNIWPFQVDF